MDGERYQTSLCETLGLPAVTLISITYAAVMASLHSILCTWYTLISFYRRGIELPVLLIEFSNWQQTRPDFSRVYDSSFYSLFKDRGHYSLLLYRVWNRLIFACHNFKIVSNNVNKLRSALHWEMDHSFATRLFFNGAQKCLAETRGAHHTQSNGLSEKSDNPVWRDTHLRRLNSYIRGMV